MSPASSLSHHEQRIVFPEDSDWGLWLDRSTSLAAASFKVTDGHRLVGLTLGFTFICGSYARQVWQFGPALIFVLTFISSSKWMTRAVAKGCAGKRIDAAETQLAIPERGQSIDFAVRSSAERRGSSPRKMRLNIARCVSMARSTASLPITTRACAIRLRATPHDGARLRSTSHRKTAAVLWAKPSHAIGAAAAWAGFDVGLDLHFSSPG